MLYFVAASLIVIALMFVYLTKYVIMFIRLNGELTQERFKLLDKLNNANEANVKYENYWNDRKANLYASVPSMNEPPFKDSIFSRPDIMKMCAEDPLQNIEINLFMAKGLFGVRPCNYFVHCKLVIPHDKEHSIFILQDPMCDIRTEPFKINGDFAKTLSGRMLIARLEVREGRVYMLSCRRTVFDLAGNVLAPDEYSRSKKI